MFKVKFLTISGSLLQSLFRLKIKLKNQQCVPNSDLRPPPLFESIKGTRRIISMSRERKSFFVKRRVRAKQKGVFSHLKEKAPF